MKILLTGATGYVGKRLLPALVNDEHQVVCGVRDKNRFHPPPSIRGSITIIQLDLLDVQTMQNIPEDIDAAFYLVHSMSSSVDYLEQEKQSAQNFRERLSQTNAKQVIYLSGIVNEKQLSEHLSSRKNVEEELDKGKYGLTTLRAGIIIGSGSASFEIIRDLVEKLPVMVAPKWLNTKCQPIGIVDVIECLRQVLGNEKTLRQSFDIGGPDVLTYKKMLLEFAKVRGLKRNIWIVPVMTPRLSSYWLYFVTSTSYKLAVALVDSMKVEVVCKDNRLQDLLGYKTMSYETALQKAFSQIESNSIVSSWKDAYASSDSTINVSDFIEVPTFGCFVDKREMYFSEREKCIQKIWEIGGKKGWYYANWLWRIRGFMDKMVGGVGLRRGRTNDSRIFVGDALDFWRVLFADKEQGRLLLFAEMKLPGDAWLEFSIEENRLVQTATFRPKGLLGRFYWYSVLPFHSIIFGGMIKRIAK